MSTDTESLTDTILLTHIADTLFYAVLGFLLELQMSIFQAEQEATLSLRGKHGRLPKSQSSASPAW